MSRAELRQFAEDRILDAQALLAAGRWTGAYYLSGYAVECGLKSCVLAHIERTGMIFKDRKYLRSLGDCWTHDLDQLVQLAELKAERDRAGAANANLFISWGTVLLWRETSRYEQKAPKEAQDIFNAITHPTDGVLPWIRLHW